MLRHLICITAVFMFVLPPSFADSSNFSVESLGSVKSNGVRHVNAIEAQALIDSVPDIVIVDVRTPKEFKKSHIEGAINIDFYASSFKSKVSKLDPSKTYLIHCQTGIRSGRSVPIMLKHGIKNLVHMDGGFRQWEKSGLAKISD